MPLSIEITELNEKERIVVESFRANQGDCWHVLGQNGAGKSSLLLALAGLLGKPNLKYFEQHYSAATARNAASYRCFLHQQQHVEFDITLRQALRFYARMESVPPTLEKHLDIDNLLDKPISRLSGGQQQRFHIARCLSQIWRSVEAGRGIILFDEPLAQLDIKFQAKLVALLQLLCEGGNTVVMTCHDIEQSKRHASHVLLIKNHRVIHSGVASDCLQNEYLSTTFEHNFSL